MSVGRQWGAWAVDTVQWMSGNAQNSTAGRLCHSSLLLPPPTPPHLLVSLVEKLVLQVPCQLLQAALVFSLQAVANGSTPQLIAAPSSIPKPWAHPEFKPPHTQPHTRSELTTI